MRGGYGHESFVYVIDENERTAEVTFYWYACTTTPLPYIPAPSGKYKNCGVDAVYAVGLAGMGFWKHFPNARILEAREEFNSVGGVRKVIIRFKQ